MSGANTFKFVMLPPQTEVTREWGRKLGDTMPEVLKLMRQMFLVRIETLKKRKWGRQRLD